MNITSGLRRSQARNFGISPKFNQFRLSFIAPYAGVINHIKGIEFLAKGSVISFHQVPKKKSNKPIQPTADAAAD